MEDFAYVSNNQRTLKSPFRMKNVLLFGITIIVAIGICIFYYIYTSRISSPKGEAYENPFVETPVNPFSPEIGSETKNPFGEVTNINPFDQFDRNLENSSGEYQNPF